MSIAVAICGKQISTAFAIIASSLLIIPTTSQILECIVSAGLTAKRQTIDDVNVASPDVLLLCCQIRETRRQGHVQRDDPFGLVGVHISNCWHRSRCLRGVACS